MARRKKVKRSSWGSVIYRRERKKWAVRIPVDGERTAAGRPRYRIYLYEGKREALDKLKELRGLHDAGRLVVRPKDAPAKDGPADGALTVLGAIDEYLAAKKAEGKSENTLGSYRAFRRSFAAHPIGKMAVAEVTPEDVEAFMAWRRENVWFAARQRGKPMTAGVVVEKREGKTASNATVNRTVALLSGALGRLVRLRKLSENPVERVTKAKEKKGARVALSKEEVARLIAAADAHFRPVLVAAFFTGARLGEITGLRWGDLNLDDGTLLLRRPKVENWLRMEMHPVLQQELKDLRKRQAAGARIPRDEDPVFLTSKGKPFRDVRYPWKKAIEAAGLAGKRGLTFHSTRHTFAVHYLENGAAISDLQAVLGHSKLTTTQVYAKMVDRRMNESIRALDYGLGKRERAMPAVAKG